MVTHIPAIPNFMVCNEPRDSQKISIPQIITNSQYDYDITDELYSKFH